MVEADPLESRSIADDGVSSRLLCLKDTTWEAVTQLAASSGLTEAQILERAVATLRCAYYGLPALCLLPASAQESYAPPFCDLHGGPPEPLAAISGQSEDYWGKEEGNPQAAPSGWSRLSPELGKQVLQRLDHSRGAYIGMQRARLLNKHWHGLVSSQVKVLGSPCLWGGDLMMKQAKIVRPASEALLSSCWQSFPCLTSLAMELTADGNLASHGLEQLECLQGLTSLHLLAAFPQQSDAVLQPLTRLTALEELALSEFCLSGAAGWERSNSYMAASRFWLDGCTTLKSLSFTRCSVFSVALQALPKLPSLMSLTFGEGVQLRLEEGGASMEGAAFVWVLHCCKLLTQLHLELPMLDNTVCWLEDHHVLSLRALPLTSLSLSGLSNIYGGVSTAAITSLLLDLAAAQTYGPLQILGLPDTCVTDELLVAITYHTALSSLSLSHYGHGVTIGGAAIQSLALLTSLQELRIHGDPTRDMNQEAHEHIWFRGRSLKAILEAMTSLKSAVLSNAGPGETVANFIETIQGAAATLETLAIFCCHSMSEEAVHCLTPCTALIKLYHSSYFEDDVSPESWSVEMLEALRPLRCLEALRIPAASCSQQEAYRILPQVKQWTVRRWT